MPDNPIPVEDSSGCVYCDLNLPCQAPGCEVCESSNNRLKTPMVAQNHKRELALAAACCISAIGMAVFLWWCWGQTPEMLRDDWRTALVFFPGALGLWAIWGLAQRV